MMISFGIIILIFCILHEIFHNRMHKRFIFFTQSFVSEKKSKDTLHDKTKDQFWRRKCSCFSSSCLHNSMTTSNVHINEIAPQTIGTCFACHLSPTPNSVIDKLNENGFRNCANKKRNKGRTLFLLKNESK